MPVTISMPSHFSMLWCSLCLGQELTRWMPACSDAVLRSCRPAGLTKIGNLRLTQIGGIQLARWRVSLHASTGQDGTVNVPIKILNVDDHPMWREGIAAVLAGETSMTLVAEASNGCEAIKQFRHHRPDVTLMDLQMPVLNGHDAIRVIRGEFPDARIIVLTTYSDDEQARRAIDAGAAGYLLKSVVRKELVKTIRKVYAGQ